MEREEDSRMEREEDSRMEREEDSRIEGGTLPNRGRKTPK